MRLVRLALAVSVGLLVGWVLAGILHGARAGRPAEIPDAHAAEYGIRTIPLSRPETLSALEIERRLVGAER